MEKTVDVQEASEGRDRGWGRRVQRPTVSWVLDTGLGIAKDDSFSVLYHTLFTSPNLFLDPADA